MEEEAGTHPAAGRLPGPVAAMYGRSGDADTVHHIYPAEEYPEYEWMDWNLISVSRATHNRVREPEDRRIDKGRTDAAASHPSDGRLEERTWMNY